MLPNHHVKERQTDRLSKNKDKLSLNIFTMKKRPTCELIYKIFSVFLQCPMKWAAKDLKPDKH